MSNLKCQSCGPQKPAKSVEQTKEPESTNQPGGIPTIQQYNYVCDSCTPWDRKAWGNVKVPEGMDPCLYNVLNGCWLCNFDKQNMENDYLMDRRFFNGIMGPPCNLTGNKFVPRNSKDEFVKN